VSRVFSCVFCSFLRILCERFACIRSPKFLMKTHKSRYLKGRKTIASPIPANCSVVRLVDNYFQAFNAGRPREACQLFTGKMLQRDVTVGMSLTGAPAPAGLGGSCVVPLMESGLVDWIVTTGANLYHDTHFSIGRSLHRGSPFLDDGSSARRVSSASTTFSLTMASC
jgi:deoxyhypusine synthase